MSRFHNPRVWCPWSDDRDSTYAIGLFGLVNWLIHMEYLWLVILELSDSKQVQLDIDNWWSYDST